MKVTSLESSLTWQFVGNDSASISMLQQVPDRAAVLTALGNSVSKAKEEGHLVAILDDFNAAPPEGRWGYSKWSAAVLEDRTMTDWVIK